MALLPMTVSAFNAAIFLPPFSSELTMTQRKMNAVPAFCKLL